MPGRFDRCLGRLIDVTLTLLLLALCTVIIAGALQILRGLLA